MKTTDYKIGDIITLNGKDYMVCKPYEEEWRCAGCALEDNCDAAPVNSKGYICTDINSEEAIFVEVGKEKESKLEWLQNKLNVAEFEVKILQQKIEELKKED